MNEAKTHDNMIIFLLLAFSAAKVNCTNPEIKRDSEDRVNVTIFNITEEDNGTYWFGSGNDTDHGIKPEIFSKTEVTPLNLEPPILPPAAYSYLFITILGVCVAVLVLLVVVIVFIKKGIRRNDAPPQINRQAEYDYEVQSPTARRAVTTVYTTADPCKESLHFMTVDFGKRGNTSEPKPSSSHCQYSTVFNKGADTCTIQEAPSEEPLYCNINRKY